MVLDQPLGDVDHRVSGNLLRAIPQLNRNPMLIDWIQIDCNWIYVYHQNSSLSMWTVKPTFCNRNTLWQSYRSRNVGYTLGNETFIGAVFCPLVRWDSNRNENCAPRCSKLQRRRGGTDGGYIFPTIQISVAGYREASVGVGYEVIWHLWPLQRGRRWLKKLSVIRYSWNHLLPMFPVCIWHTRLGPGVSQAMRPNWNVRSKGWELSGGRTSCQYLWDNVDLPSDSVPVPRFRKSSFAVLRKDRQSKS